jgi:hypothetical protein
MFDINLQFPQDAAKYPQGTVVRTDQQGREIHDSLIIEKE